ncbi:MAG: glycosyltransferase family 4 protein, partial [Planctomycetes bacterium]|nr:glycosyltransferase family 4 protein [Planctomycetota bacterium]
MRILFVCDYYQPRGGGAIEPLCEELSSRGHGICLLAGAGAESLSHPAERSACVSGNFDTVLVPYHKGSSLLEGARFLQRVGRAARRLAERASFDVLCLSQPLSGAGVLLSGAFARSRRAYCFHSPWQAEWAIEHPRPTFAGAPRRWLAYQRNALLRNILEDWVLRRCHAYMVLSRFMRSRLLRCHPRIAPQRVRLIPGGTDTRRFSSEGGKAAARRRLGLPLRRPILLTVRRLVARMGLDALLQALPAVLEAVPKALLLVGGTGPLRPRLEELSARLGTEAAVRFLGHVASEQLPLYYRAAHLFVLPTRSLEGFGLVTIEALASGTPVVGTPVGGTVEILTGLDAGLLAADASPAALAERVTWWL